MAIEAGIELIKAIFVNTTILNIGWVMSLFLTLITLLIITRDTQKWQFLALPVTVMWHIAGVPPFIGIYMLEAIAFSITVLSTQTISGLIDTYTGRVKTGEVTKMNKKLIMSEHKRRRKKDISKLSDKELWDAILKAKGK